MILNLLATTVLLACSNNKKSQDDAQEKILIYGRGADSVKLDPAKVADTESLTVTKNIMETLINFDEGSTELVLALAKNGKEINRLL